MIGSWCLLGLWAVTGLQAPGTVSAAESQLRPWTNYQTIMWVEDTAYKQPDRIGLFFQRMREMGINTAMVYGDGSPSPVLEHRFPYYVENLVNRGLCLKWSSKVADWDKFVTGWARNGRLQSALVRDYCLDDPQWRGWARGELERIVRKNQPHAPLAYDLRDELSTTISANPFDYDFNPITLASFRVWLKSRYADVPALNAQWETRFGTWEDVRPFTTDQIKNRMGSGEAQPRGQPDWQAVQGLRFDPEKARTQPTRWNFSPWCDFRTYMDLSLAGALEHLRQASHALDPRTPVGIEGTQMPHAFGGYDLWRLSQVLDWVEPYDIACSREIFGSFMPGKPIVCTVFEKETHPALRRLWHLLLLGDKGCIIWWSQDCLDWKSADYSLTPKAKALAPVLQEMTSPLARLFLRARRETDPIFIHYSQASVQVAWLMESTVDGSTWLRRFSSFESDHNRQAKVRAAWLKAFQDLGYAPRFVATDQLERGALNAERDSIVVLPNSWALTAREAQALQDFVRPGSTNAGQRLLFCDGVPGLFDGHGRLRPQELWPEWKLAGRSQETSWVLSSRGRPAQSRAGDIAQFGMDRLRSQASTNWLGWIEPFCRNLPRAVRLSEIGGGEASARTLVHRCRVGTARLLAFERNINYHMSEDLKQAGGNEALEKPVELEATLAQGGHLYDLRTQRYLGQTSRFTFRLDPWRPSLFALLPEKAPEGSLLDRLLSQGD